MTALFGAAAPLAGRLAVAVLDGEPLALAGAALYVLGALGITIAGNVPLNDALAGLDPASGAAQWHEYVRRWTALNHVRVAAGAAAAGLLAASA